MELKEPNIHDTNKNNLDLARKLKSFNNYAAQVKTEKLANKILIDNLINQLAQAKVVPAPVNNDIIDKLEKIEEQLTPVNKFFNNIQKTSAPSKMSKEEKQVANEEAMEAAMRAKAMKKLSKKG